MAKQTELVIADETNWDRNGWLWRTCRPGGYERGDEVLLLDKSTKPAWASITRVVDVVPRTATPTPDGRCFDAWIATFAEAERGPAGIDAANTLLTYMFRVIDRMHHDQLRAKIRQLGPHAEETAMTIAEQWHEEGRIAALRSLLSSKFGSQALDAAYEARLQAATPAVVDDYLQRVLVADSLAAVFED